MKSRKLKLISLVLCAVLVFSLLPVSAFAYTDGFGKVFDQNEYDQLKAFLELTSASGEGYSNGRCMSFMYDVNDPLYWSGVTWTPFTEGTDTVYHVTLISWNAYDLNGDLDLSGFDELLTFSAGNNQIDNLSVQKDTKLSTLFCSRTQITSLDLTTNTALEYLDCSLNSLKLLDLSKNTNLKGVNCSSNKIITLDTSAAGKKLESLECNDNEISSLTISGNSSLKTLDCSNNHISGTLDLNDRTSLGILSCFGNQLTSVVTTGCTSLKRLSCSSNKIGSLDLSGNTALEELYCASNNLSALNVDSNKALTIIECQENQIIDPFSVINNKNLKSLSCGSNDLTALSVGTNTALTGLYCSDNNISELIVTANTALTNLDCSQNNISALDVSANVNLNELKCDDNLLTLLNVGNNTLLSRLTCGGNKLGSLDVTKNTSLESLKCNNDGLSALDITNNTSLFGLDCSGNQLKTLDLTKNTNLADLNCSDNEFKTLDLTKNTNLFGLDCSGNQFESLDISSLFLAMGIDCRDNPLTNLKAAIPYEDKASAIELHTNGEGYIGLYYIWDDDIADNMFIEATPKAAGTFVNWTDAKNAEVSKSAKYQIEYNTEYNLTANFACVVSFDTDGGSAVSSQNVLPGKKASKPADPSKAGFAFGGWYKDKSLTKAWNFDTDTVSANTTIFAKWIKAIAVGLSCTKTDVTKYGGADGSVTITASGGNSGLYEYSINGGTSWQKANTFSGLTAVAYTAAVRDAANTANIATCAVTIAQPAFMGNVAVKKLSSTANAGTALTIVPPAAPKGYTLVSVTYSSSSPSAATVDASGNVTFLAGGKTKIITKSVYQMTDSKGKVKTKTITTAKTITVKQPAASLSLNLSSTTIERREKVKLTAAIAPTTASSKKIKWASSNPKIASVSGSGVVTGKAAGTAIITCTAKDGSGVSASCTVTVTPINPTGVKMSKTALTLKTGKTASLRATVLPKTTDFKTITFASSNPAIATVEAKGKVKAIAPGTAVITATTSNGLTVSCTVTVK